MMKGFSIILLFVLLLGIAGCSGFGSGSSSKVKSQPSGSDGITVSFMSGAPQSNYVVGDIGEPISMILEIKNKGSWPEDDYDNILDQGAVYLSGFEDEIIQLHDYSRVLKREFLPGLSLINPNGGYDTAEFKGNIRADDLVIDQYKPTILATACFPYVTKASPTVCIDPQPFDQKREKVCTIGSVNTGTQGAPVAVSKIDVQASSAKTQFKITIKNVGGGDILSLDKLDACNPRGHESLSRTDFDTVELVRASIGTREIGCSPFVFGREIKLHNGEGFIICSMDAREYQDAQDAYSTTFNIELRYGYRTTASKSITIDRITGVN